MCHASRPYRVEPFELEGRLLLSVAHAKQPAGPPYAEFVSNVLSYSGMPTEVVGQQDGQATVTLRRSSVAGSLQVLVSTPPSPGLGLNAAPVDQTVTFADGQRYASLSIPLFVGAPNPGEVDIPVDVAPISPSPQGSNVLGAFSALTLKILSNDPNAAPQVVYEGTSSATQTVQLVFNKPMDPVQAANPNNYAVTEVNQNAGGGRGGILALFGLHSKPTTTTKYTTPLSAHYDPATDSVTLTLKKERVAVIQMWTSVDLVNPTKALAAVAKASVATQSQGLDDLQGNPINASTKPGKIGIRVETSAGGNYGFPI
jgi:hypothetical protein